MKSDLSTEEAADVEAMISRPDRTIIRIDIPSASAGIAAALRSAFAAAAAEPCDRDFADLLRKLS